MWLYTVIGMLLYIAACMKLLVMVVQMFPFRVMFISWCCYARWTLSRLVVFEWFSCLYFCRSVQKFKCTNMRGMSLMYWVNTADLSTSTGRNKCFTKCSCMSWVIPWCHPCLGLGEDSNCLPPWRSTMCSTLERRDPVSITSFLTTTNVRYIVCSFVCVLAGWVSGPETYLVWQVRLWFDHPSDH